MFKIPPDQKDKWTCERDVDCLRSCSHGAVAKAWYAKQRARIRECKGGCAGSKSAAPRCVEGRCVAFDRQGNWYPACSARKGTLTKVP